VTTQALPAAPVLGRPSWPVVRRGLLLVLVASASLYGVVHLVGGFGAATRGLTSVQPWWVVAAVVAGSASYPAAALSQLGSVAGRVPLHRLVAAQVASAFTNRLLPVGAGGMATNVRCMRRSGMETGTAGTAVATTAVAGIVVHVLTLIAVVPVLLTVPAVRHAVAGSGIAVAATVAVVLVVAAVLVRPPAPVRRLLARVHAERAHLGATLRHPGRVALLLGGSLGVTVAHAAAFVAALHAVGAAAPLLLVVAVYVGAVTAAGLIPAPGGAGGLDVTLLAGLSAAGLSSASAVTAVLLFRLLTFWLPTIPGAITMVVMLRRRLL